MIKQINHNGTVRTIILGYLALKEMSIGQSQNLDGLQVIENVAVVGFQTAAKREGTPVPTREEVQEWFDDFSFYMAVQEAVEEFSVNFSKEAEKLKKAKK